MYMRCCVTSQWVLQWLICKVEKMRRTAIRHIFKASNSTRLKFANKKNP